MRLIVLVLLLAPMVQACTPPQPPQHEFALARFEDGALVTNLDDGDGSATTQVRINLNDGRWEADGVYKPWGSRGPDNVTAGNLVLDWNWGNQCCLCGPYHSGFQILRDGYEVASYGGPDDSDAPPLSGYTAKAGTDTIIVLDETKHRLMRYTADGVEQFDAPESRPGGWFVGEDAFLAFRDGTLIHLNETATAYELPGQTLTHVDWADPPVLAGWHWVATFDNGFHDVVVHQGIRHVPGYLMWPGGVMATYPGNQTIGEFDGQLTMKVNDGLWILEAEPRTDGQWARRYAEAIHHYDGAWTTYTKDWSDPDEIWFIEKEEPVHVGPAPQPVANPAPHPLPEPTEDPSTSPDASQDAPAPLLLLPLLAALLRRRR